MAIERIISGGQTGADRGGLDAAIALGLSHGGYCPKRRRAEDGVIPAHYQLEETAGAEYEDRTRLNVLAADATVIFTCGELIGGTLLTATVARDVGKPLLLLDMRDLGDATVEQFRRWVAHRDVHVLNVAGTRESACPGIQESVGAFIQRALAALPVDA